MSAGPRVLLVGRNDGWMRFHLEQLASGLRDAGAHCTLVDYRTRTLDWVRRRLFPERYEGEILRRRSDRLIAEVRRNRADVVLTYAGFEFDRVVDATDARVAFWDWDGLLGYVEDLTNPLPGGGIDVFFSISREAARVVADQTTVPAFYLPHGVDLDFWSPAPVDEKTRRRIAAPLCFVGQPSDRRLALLEPLADLGLALWGRRWREKGGAALGACARDSRDVVGAAVVDIYRASDVVLNVLRAEVHDFLSLQVFQTPATATCLLTEWRPELEEAFEIGREVLAFRSPDELRALAERYARDTDAAHKIGAAGRARCEAEHSHAQRAEFLLRQLRQVL